jgi:pyrroline-5-carboxylate reductase
VLLVPDKLISKVRGGDTSMSSSRKKGETVAVIGAGVIGGAIAKSLNAGGRRRVIATRRVVSNAKELADLGVEVTTDNRRAAKAADVIFLCVKPGDVSKTLGEISAEVAGKLVISTAATVPLSFYGRHAPKARFVRAMPNIAVLVNEAFTGFCCGEGVTDEDRRRVRALFEEVGTCAEVEEKHMDAITALSGSGPGYLSIIIEGLMYAGLRVGLPRDLALMSSAQTVLGTGKLVLELKENPAKVKDMVTTPGGTTIEAIYELEGSQIRPALMRAVKEATERSRAIREMLKMEE